MINLNKINDLFLNNDEVAFIRDFSNSVNNKFGSTFFIQCTSDYFYLKLYSLLLKQEAENIKHVVGLVIIPFRSSMWEKIFFLPFMVKVILNLLRIRKIKRLYKSIGVNQFYTLYSVNIITRIINFSKSFLIFNKINSETDVINIKINGVNCGDLIYDTVVRFSDNPSLKVKSFNFFITLYEAFNYIYLSRLICNKFSISNAFLNLAVYTHHGITARCFLNKNVNVYTSGHFPLFKKLSIEDPSMLASKFRHEKLMKENILDEKIIRKSYESFGKRFQGEDDLGIIKHFKINPYHKQNVEFCNKNEDYEGVLFLHDFYDSHKLYCGATVFSDFVTWARYTLNLINKHKLSIAIKPHPLQIRESETYVKKLQIEFSNLKWIDPKTSNLEIFKREIFYGISHHGTVLSELAYHGITPISCSENPLSAYDICYEAQTIDEYENFIVNAKSLPKKENVNRSIGLYYHNHYKTESDFIIKSKLINGVNISNSNRYYFTSKDLLIDENVI